MDHIQNRPMDERSIVDKENVNPLSNDQNSHCEWCRRFWQLRWHLLLSQTFTSTLRITLDTKTGIKGGTAEP